MSISTEAFVFYGVYCPNHNEDSLDKIIPYDHEKFGTEFTCQYDGPLRYFIIIKSTKTFIYEGQYREIRNLNVETQDIIELNELLTANGIEPQFKWYLGMQSL